jgi:two-component system, NtrC family, sensor kinase
MHKILLIDDEPDILRVLGISLRADGYAVQTASSGEEALAIFARETPELVITDIKMPGLSGIEVLREVKNINAETEVIIITGHGDIDSAIEALHFGASDFINKPVRDKQLTIALTRAQEKIHIKQPAAGVHHHPRTQGRGGNPRDPATRELPEQVDSKLE